MREEEEKKFNFREKAITPLEAGIIVVAFGFAGEREGERERETVRKREREKEKASSGDL